MIFVPDLSLDLTAEPLLPVLSTPETREPAVLHEIAEALVLQPRYRKRDVTGDQVDETFCNFLVREFLRMLGIDLPRMRANEFAKYFRSPQAVGELWTWQPIHIARDLAQLGRPVVAVQDNPSGPGHVAMLMPAKTPADADLARKMATAWCAQAGAANFAYGTLRQGFHPKRPIIFFAHP